MSDRRWMAGWIGTLMLGAWTVYEFVRPQPNPTTPAPSQLAAETALELPQLEVIPPGLDDLRITLDRPLFNVSRKPEQLATDSPETTPPDSYAATPPPLRLSAVIIDEQGRSALLEPVETNIVQRVPEGESIAGWRLIEVREDAVVLLANGNRSELALRVFEPPTPVRASPSKRPSRAKRIRVPTRQPNAARRETQTATRIAKERAKRLEQARSGRPDEI